VTEQLNEILQIVRTVAGPVSAIVFVISGFVIVEALYLLLVVFYTLGSKDKAPIRRRISPWAGR
jgi:hypothetical protein